MFLLFKFQMFYLSYSSHYISNNIDIRTLKSCKLRELVPVPELKQWKVFMPDSNQGLKWPQLYLQPVTFRPHEQHF